MASKRRAPPAAFEDFFAAFSRSVHADVHLRDGEIVLSHASGLLNDALVGQSSVEHSRPSTRSSPSTKAPALLPRLPQQASTAVVQDSSLESSPLPRHLLALTSLQASDGSWRFDDKFQFVINEAAPPPPEGIHTKLWATAVVLTIFRQFPEYFPQLESAYEKAMLHVDEDVLRLAKSRVDTSGSAMDRIRVYQNNEAKEIRERLAREAAAKRAEEDAEEHRLELERKRTIYISKYSLFRARHLAMETQERMRTALTTDVQAIFPPTTRKPPKQLRPQEMEIMAGDAVECCWRRLDGSKFPQRHQQWRVCLVTTINSDGKTVNVHYLEEPFERERNVRFKYVRLITEDARERRGLAFDRLREQWVLPIGLQDELERLDEIEARRKYRPPWESRSLPALPTIADLQPMATIPVYSPRKRLTITPEAIRKPPTDSKLEGLYQSAVTAALAYQKLYAQVPRIVKAASQRYKSALLFQERFHAFDEFLQTSVELVTLSVTALERIELWASHEPVSNARVFVWHGQEFVIGLLKSLDFLSSYPQVCEWYGDDFAFSMNPFLTAESIRDLVQDRGLQFTAKLRPLAAENALRVALRMHKKEVESGQPKQPEIPSWWPPARFDQRLHDRIKRSEAFVLSYLCTHGYVV